MTTLAIDLDGTLLHPENMISEANRRALLALPPETDIVICSARPLRAILSLMNSAGLLPVLRAIGACNGAVIYDCLTQSVLSRTSLSPAMLSPLRNVLTTGWHAFSEDALLCPPGEISEYTIHESELFGMPIQTLAADDILSRADIIKITLCGEAETLLCRADTLRPQLPADISAFFTDQHYFELVPASVSKGNILHILAARGILRPGTIMAIGDQENDLSLFAAADIRVAMGNAVPALKQAAGYITAECREDGVAAALQHYRAAFRKGA
ncbi:HAD family phosphatase [Morganella morganii]|uniref:Cof-type HAD-IIB family hydrolase n=1 Tax=Morganella morganii TaxID=582 RepID=UPI000D1DE5EE|nr:Cof-type HAD-IIB family hydrolase [Morganella morganii]HAE78367.1 Cof-type HAD-IIB family hydrolase [Morganella sp. (in: enterobacteria)]QXO43493.1 HAD family phosphatase [Morganella morganii]QXO47085.1 HAD family phosphatase [Morganella morganii]QXO50857.1 HAD family phosphatase [Morganella morganii]QXO54723.1 HAD family phosphatase [Morganella morganii]